ncbi:MAG: FKBP-type peptidyl-prolyl cis-trans isomerase [Xanthomonadales bacterium]|nr:FKBP-type peptidyl-prolyl cis-trans isomerase [Xanthomonadales bacterium]
MVFRIAALLGLLGAMGASAQELSSDQDKLSYAIGYQIGTDFKYRDMDLNMETVIRALRDAINEQDPAVPEQEMAAMLRAMQERMQAEQLEKFKQLAEENKQKSEQFLADNKSKKNIVVLPSGVQYRIIEEGEGSRPTAESEVVVHYRSSTMNGLEFDSSFARGEPVTFKVNQVIKGWQEILPLMKTGATWQVFVPPELAYGIRGQRPVGPNEALVFDINLVEVKS